MSLTDDKEPHWRGDEVAASAANSPNVTADGVTQATQSTQPRSPRPHPGAQPTRKRRWPGVLGRSATRSTGWIPTCCTC